MIVHGSNDLPSLIDKASTQKLNKEMLVLSAIISDPKIFMEHFTQTQKSMHPFQHLTYFSRMGHIPRHKTVSTHKKNQIMPCIPWIEAGYQKLQKANKYMKIEQFTTDNISKLMS